MNAEFAPLPQQLTPTDRLPRPMRVQCILLAIMVFCIAALALLSAFLMPLTLHPSWSWYLLALAIKTACVIASLAAGVVTMALLNIAWDGCLADGR